MGGGRQLVLEQRGRKSLFSSRIILPSLRSILANVSSDRHYSSEAACFSTPSISLDLCSRVVIYLSKNGSSVTTCLQLISVNISGSGIRF